MKYLLLVFFAMAVYFVAINKDGPAFIAIAALLLTHYGEKSFSKQDKNSKSEPESRSEISKPDLEI